MATEFRAETLLPLRRYMGVIILPCERAPGEHRGKWTTVSFHGPTGLPYADDCCAHFPTLAAAKEAVRLGNWMAAHDD